MKDRMTLNTFAKKVGFKNGHAYGFKGHLHILERMGALEVKQGGYMADSLHHPKIVKIKNAEAVALHFKLPSLSRCRRLPLWKRTRKCHHKDFAIIVVTDTIFAVGKTIRKVILKCGHCHFYLAGIEVDGMMEEMRPLT